jgi:hypothetical protein
MNSSLFLNKIWNLKLMLTKLFSKINFDLISKFANYVLYLFFLFQIRAVSSVTWATLSINCQSKIRKQNYCFRLRKSIFSFYLIFNRRNHTIFFKKNPGFWLEGIFRIRLNKNTNLWANDDRFYSHLQRFRFYHTYLFFSPVGDVLAWCLHIFL